MSDELLRVGGREVTMGQAAEWVRSYFDQHTNRSAVKPYAYPAYDRLATGSGPHELNDGDLLAPSLLNAAPSIRAFYSLQAVRPILEKGLTAIPPGLTLQAAVAEDRHRPLLAGIVEVLDTQPVPDVRLTTLIKVLHRKRPLFLPLYDSKIWTCYVGPPESHPIQPRPGRSWLEFSYSFSECVVSDLDSQPGRWRRLAQLAPDDVPVLRLLDVVAWNAGKDTQ